MSHGANPHSKHETDEEGARGASEARGRGLSGGGVKELGAGGRRQQSTRGAQESFIDE